MSVEAAQSPRTIDPLLDSLQAGQSMLADGDDHHAVGRFLLAKLLEAAGAGQGFIAETNEAGTEIWAAHGLAAAAGLGPYEPLVAALMEGREDSAADGEGRACFPLRYAGRTIGAIGIGGDSGAFAADLSHRLGPFLLGVAGLAKLHRAAEGRKKAETELAQLAALMRGAISQSRAGIMIFSAPDGQAIMANSAAIDICGLIDGAQGSLPQPIPPFVWTMRRPDGSAYRPGENPIARAIRHGEIFCDYEAQIQAPDGRRRWILANIAPIYDANAVLFAGVAVFSDVTDRKESEARFRAIADYTYDWETWFAPDGRARWINPGVERVCGHSPEACLAMEDYPFPLIHPEDRAAVANVLAEAARGVEGNDVEFRILRKDGGSGWCAISWQPIFLSGMEPLGFRTSIRDITRRKRAALALKESEARLRAAIEGSMDAFAILAAEPGPAGAPQDFTVVQSNANFESLFQLSSEAVLGMPIGELVPEFGGGPLLDALVQVRQSGQAIEVEQRPEPVSEKGRWLRHQIVPMPGGVAVTTRDVSEQARAAMRERDIRDKMQRAQRLESLGVMAGGIAHDFNNLLMGIMASAGLAAWLVPPDSEAAPHIEQVKAASAQTAELIKQLLLFSGKKSNEPRPIDLSLAVSEIADIVKATLSKRVSLVLRLAPRLPAIAADPAQIRQVILNLVTNASDAVGDREGCITIATGRLHADAAYLSQCELGAELPPGEFIFLEIGDSGGGIDEATRSQIFDPFFTTKQHSGTGLGLSIVAGIVRTHRGAILVRSAPGDGARFRVLFPIGAAIPAPAAPARLPGRDWRASGRALVIDDEPRVRTTIAAILRHAGLTAECAADGREGIDRLSAEPLAFDLVVLDMTMPRLNGAETLRALRAMRPDLPTLLVSGYTELKEASLGSGGDGVAFLPKPFLPEELLGRIQDLLGPRARRP